MKLLIVDQFSGPTPYDLRHDPVNFDALCERVLAAINPGDWNKPRVIEATDDYQPRLCETVIRAREDGMAEVWRYNWDTSG